MGSPGRKLRRKKEREQKKAAKKNLKKALSAVSGLPTNCSKCNSNFVFDDHADDWQVCAENGTVSLLCPICFEQNN